MASTRKQTKEWEPWYDFSEDRKFISCTYCRATFGYKRKRAFAHYGYNPSTERGICTKIPTAVRRRFENCGGFVPMRMNANELCASTSMPSVGMGLHGSQESTHDNNDPNAIEGDEPGSSTQHLSESPIPNASESTHAPSVPTRQGSHTPRSHHLRQQQMIDAFHVAKRAELDEKWASFFYEANVPFNVGRHPAFIAAVKATSSAGFPYDPPTYHQLRTKLIEPKKLRVETEIKKKTEYSIKQYGATISSDGWDNVSRRPLMNIMITCPAGDIFLGSIDTTGKKKTKQYIAGEMKRFIEEVGPNNIAQVCTDNASNMLGAMDDIVETYPHIYKQGCAAHALDLLLEDWAKIQEFKDLIVRAKRICVYIRNHHVTMAVFRESCKDKSLIVPSETRFACNFLMIQRMLEVRQSLEDVVTHPRVVEYTRSLFNRQNGNRAQALASMVHKTVMEGNFWHRCRNYVHMVEEVLKALRTFDGSQPCMGRAWFTMHNLEKHVFSLRDEPFKVPSRIADTLEKSFRTRWDMMHTDLHYAGALLNPYLKDSVEVQENRDAIRGLNRVVRRMCGSVGVTFNEVMSELTEYEERRGPYSAIETPDIREARLQPHQWWHRIGDKALSRIAKRVLSLTCSASSCERNWSMYSFVHNKSRNRLGVDKAEALVYIYTNSKVLRERPVADPVRWYDNNVESEDSDAENIPPSDVGSGEENGDAFSDEDNYVVAGGAQLWGGSDDDSDAYMRPRGPRRRVDEVFAPSVFDFDGDDYHVGPILTASRILSPTNSSSSGDSLGPLSPNIPSPLEVQIETPIDTVLHANIEEDGHVERDDHAITPNSPIPTINAVLGTQSDRSDIPPMVGTSTTATIPTVVSQQESEGEIGVVANTPIGNSIGSTLARLGHQLRNTSKPPLHGTRNEPKHTLEENIPSAPSSCTSGGLPTLQAEAPRAVCTRGTSSTRSNSSADRGVKRAHVAILPFLSSTSEDNGFSSPTLVFGPRMSGPPIGSDAEEPAARRHKKFVRTNNNGNASIELRNENSEIEGLVQSNYGDENDVLGDDENEGEDDFNSDCDEAPLDDDVNIRTTLGLPRRLHRRRSSRLRNSVTGGEREEIE